MVGRWLTLLLALGGLVAMHGLSGHGVAGPVVGATGAMAATSPLPAVGGAGSGRTAGPGSAPPAGHTGHRTDPPRGGEVAPRPAAGADDGRGSEHGGHHGASAPVTCLAVLAALLLLGAPGWRTGLPRQVRRTRAETALLAPASAFRARARDPVPPDLAVLSILRC